jgi:DNA (cytosine-5)-methyltransferase 1
VGESPESFLARREREKAKHRNGNGFGLTLGMAVQMWPTPKASPSGPDFAKAGRPGSGADDLATAVARRIRWPTPRSSDYKGAVSYATALPSVGHFNLPEMVQVERGPGPSGGGLNPAWVEWLMGFPPGWTALED